jgi:DNA segregation ATPase FtsK/SpoIIIE-like protein
MEERKRQLALNLNFNKVKRMPIDERKVQLAADFKFNWVKMMPLDMVREFHKNLDYESRIAELLHKYPCIRRQPNENGPTLDNFFTHTQIGKIWQEGFVKKITDLKGNKRVLKKELVEMFPERPARIYIDMGGNEQVWTGIRHKLITDFERGARPIRREGTVRAHDIRFALRSLLNVRTEFPVFDRFLRRTAYYLIAGIIIFRETVIADRIKREAILAAKAEARHKEYLEMCAANHAIRQAEKNACAAARTAAKNARNAARTAAKNALNAERAGMRAEEKATRDLAKAQVAAQAKVEKQAAAAQAKAEKQAAAEQAKAAKQAAAEQAKAAKQAAAEQAKAEKQAAAEQAKAAKQAAAEQAKAEKQAAAEQAKAEKQAAAEQAKAAKQAAAEQAKAAKQAAAEQAKAAKQAAKVVVREKAKAEKQAAKVVAREKAKAEKQVKTEKRVVKVVLRIRQPKVE